MSDTTVTPVTSGAKSCTECGAAFGDDDDKRYSRCTTCRASHEPDTVAREGVEVVELDLSRSAPPPAPPRNFYWIGVTPDAPWHYVTAGGVAFQKHRGEVTEGDIEGRQEFRDKVAPGAPIHNLTDAHVARIKEEVALRVVRNYRTERREVRKGVSMNTYHGDILSTKSTKQGGSPLRQYVANEGDRPLGEFLWMIRVRHKDDRPFSGTPPTMVKRPE